MQVVLCDSCLAPLIGAVTELHLMHGEAVATDHGRALVPTGGPARLLYLCGACGSWMESAFEHLRDASVGTGRRKAA
ncbi:MAG: hypothetical protein R3C39_10620 [Dehalococcoidia bacterium]